MLGILSFLTNPYNLNIAKIYINVAIKMYRYCDTIRYYIHGHGMEPVVQLVINW